MSLPLNAMQQAYLMGRTSGFPLGSVDMQDIRSFYLPASAAQVADAMLEVFAVYPMLSSRVSQDGLFLLQKEDLDYQDNFIISQGSLSQQQSMWQIAEQQIERFISATFDIHKRLWRVALHEFTDDESCVVTFAFNGLLLDGYVISRLIKEVFKLALGGDFTPSLTGVSKGIESNEEPIDEGYGQDYFKAVRQVIQLPWASDLEEIMWTKRKRFSMTLERDLFEQVSNNLLKQGVFANSGYMFAVLKALSAFVGEQHVFAISVPTADSAIKKSFSTNSSFLPIVYDDSRSTSWLEQLIHLQRLVLGLLSTNRLGVIAAQRLSKQLRTILPLPVAFTNGLLWDAHESSEGLVYLGGVTETPQLALDIRLSHLNDKRVLLDLDYAEAALAEDDVIAIAKQVVTNLEKLATLDVLADVKQVIMPSERTAAVNKLSSSMGFIQSIYDKLYAQPSEDVALISQDRRINYKQLALFVASATKVLKQHDMNSGDVLAMILPKCFEQAYYLLGSLFSGVIWLSLDKEAPVERLSYQLRNAQVKGLVCDLVEMGDLVSEIRSTIRLIDVNELYEVTDALVPPALTPNTGQALSCYLYTSGSTGLPKCVALNNQGIDNTLKQTIKKWHLTKVDCFFAATPFHHDMSLFDLLVSFTVGATLVVPEKAQHKDPFLWARLVQEAGVTVWVSVPAIVDMLLLAAEPEKLRSLRVLAQGGDYIREKTIRQLLSANPQLILYSLGGPTETTIWSIWHKIDVDKDMAAYHAIPYGVALAGNQYYILDAQDNECAVGELGKIAMSGINLSNGYVVDGQLRFDDYKELVLNGKSQRVYVSRDMGRLTTDGLILFEGREEGYFKIRGVRISSQEIENAVLKIEGIDQCVAVELQNEQLSYAELGLAYTVKNKESTSYSSSQLMDALNVFLPDSHIPTQWLLLDAMPLTANGKIDRKSIQELVKLSAYPENDLTRTNAVQLNQDPADISSGGDFSLLLDEAFYKAFLNEMQSEVVEEKMVEGSPNLSRPATEYEQRAWFLHQRDPLSLMSSLNVSFHLKGDLDLIKLVSALYALYEGGSSFNTYFKMDNEGVLKRHFKKYTQSEVIFLWYEKTLKEAKERLWQQFKQPLDLQNQPIVKFYLVMLVDTGSCLLGIHAHHILMDNSAWSVILKTVSDHYNAKAEKRHTSFNDLTQFNQLDESKAALAEKERYWQDKFLEPLSCLQLPSKIEVRTETTNQLDKAQLIYSELGSVRYVQKVLPEELKSEYRELSLAQLIGRFGKFLLSKTTQEFIDILTPITNTQIAYQLDSLQSTGNVLPIRVVKFQGDLSIFSDKDVQTQIEQGLIHELPYESIITVTDSPRGSLPNVMVTSFEMPKKYLKIKDVSVSYLDMPPLSSPYLLMLAYCINSDGLYLELTVDRQINHLVTGALFEEFVDSLLLIKGTQVSLSEVNIKPLGDVVNEGSLLDIIMEVFANGLPRSWDKDDNFFNVGGHSLIATSVIGQLKNKYGLQVEIKDIFAHPTAHELAIYLASQNKFPADSEEIDTSFVGELQTEEYEELRTGVNYPVSLLQESYLWDAGFGSDTRFNIPFVFRINMDFEPEVMREIFAGIIMSHSAFRNLIVIGEDGVSLSQIILSAEDLSNLDWFSSVVCKDDGKAQHIAFAAGESGFDLTKNIPIRITQVRINNHNYLSVSIYHSSFDEWSAKLLIDELVLKLIEKIKNKTSNSVEGKKCRKLQYVHYAMEEFSERGKILRNGLAFWKERLGQLKEEKGLVTCFSRNQRVQNYASGRVEINHTYTPISFMFSSKDKFILNKLVKEFKISLFQVLYAIVILSLYRLGAGREIIVGTSIACRDDYKYQQTIGLFTNVVLEKSIILLNETVPEFLIRLQNERFGIGKFGKVPFPYVVQTVAERSGISVFEYYFQMHASDLMRLKRKVGDQELKIELLEQQVMPSKFGLHFEVFDGSQDDNLVFLIHYDDSKYSETSLQPLVNSLKDLISRIGNINSETTVGDFLVGSGKENLYGL
ncbi:D-alanine--D-alanyl carrier protein ligase [Oligella sp. MSHR50489EDL]|uniref:AMP-binding protein n=1 Tax=Oligella sp. MSHR50489EDL TaxID=3139409 RepID=UPI003D81550D